MNAVHIQPGIGRNNRFFTLRNLEDALARRRCRVQLPAVGQCGNRRAQLRVHTPGDLQKITECSGQYRLPAGQPTQRRGIQRVRMLTHRHLRQLLRIAQQKQIPCGSSNRQGVGERELPGFVNNEQVERALRNTVRVRKIPGGPAKKNAGRSSVTGFFAARPTGIV